METKKKGHYNVRFVRKVEIIHIFVQTLMG